MLMVVTLGSSIMISFDAVFMMTEETSGISSIFMPIFCIMRAASRPPGTPLAAFRALYANSSTLFETWNRTRIRISDALLSERFQGFLY